MNEQQMAQEVLRMNKVIEEDTIRKAQAEARVEQLIKRLVDEYSIESEEQALEFLKEKEQELVKRGEELQTLFTTLQESFPS